MELTCYLAQLVLDRWWDGRERTGREGSCEQEARDGSILKERLLISKCTEITQSGKWAQSRTAQHSAMMEIGCGGSKVACVFMCVWYSQQDGERATSEKSSFLSIVWKHSLFPSCWLCLFSATQTLLGNGFSCQKSVINIATGCGLNSRLMVIFLKGQPTYSLCRRGVLHLSFLSGRGLFNLGFHSFSHGICCSLPTPPPPSICSLILESECACNRSHQTKFYVWVAVSASNAVNCSRFPRC